MDSEKSSFAASAAAVYRRSGFAVSACDFARSFNLVFRLRPFAGAAAIGIILSESMRYLSAGMWWSAVLPGLTLVLLVLLVDKFGDYLRMILDPYSAQD